MGHFVNVFPWSGILGVSQFRFGAKGLRNADGSSAVLAVTGYLGVESWFLPPDAE